MRRIRDDLGTRKSVDFVLCDGVLVQGDHPMSSSHHGWVLAEAHFRPHSMHLGSIKMYLDLQSRYVWEGVIKSVAECVIGFLSCQRI